MFCCDQAGSVKLLDKFVESLIAVGYEIVPQETKRERSWCRCHRGHSHFLKVVMYIPSVIRHENIACTNVSNFAF